MSNILISIYPEMAEKIYTEEKLYELRRALPSDLESWDKVFMCEKGTGMVTGLFEVDDVLREKYVPALYAMTGRKTGLRDEVFFQYFKGRQYGNAIKVRDPRRFSTSISLKEFGVERPPQNFCYVRRVPADIERR